MTSKIGLLYSHLMICTYALLVNVMMLYIIIHVICCIEVHDIIRADIKILGAGIQILGECTERTVEHPRLFWNNSGRLHPH